MSSHLTQNSLVVASTLYKLRFDVQPSNWATMMQRVSGSNCLTIPIMVGHTFIELIRARTRIRCLCNCVSKHWFIIYSYTWIAAVKYTRLGANSNRHDSCTLAVQTRAVSPLARVNKGLKSAFCRRDSTTILTNQVISYRRNRVATNLYLGRVLSS